VLLPLIAGAALPLGFAGVPPGRQAAIAATGYTSVSLSDLANDTLRDGSIAVTVTR
jgi:hypothetical protein